MSHIMHRTIFALICAAFLLVVQAEDEVVLRSSIKICDHKQSNYSACLRESLQDSWVTIVNGIPELGVPKLDPLKFDKLDYDFGFGLISSHLELRNATTYGVSKTIFREVRSFRTADRMNIKVNIKIPETFVDGQYKADNRIGFFKIGGKGYFNQSSENIRSTIVLEGRIENDRWVIEHVRLYPIAVWNAKVKFYFDDLFNGNQILNKAALTFVNEFWPVVFLGMSPIVLKDWDAMLTDLANRIFSKLSFSKTFP